MVLPVDLALKTKYVHVGLRFAFGGIYMDTVMANTAAYIATSVSQGINVFFLEACPIYTLQ
jgi:hypothetical protein